MASGDFISAIWVFSSGLAGYFVSVVAGWIAAWAYVLLDEEFPRLTGALSLGLLRGRVLSKSGYSTGIYCADYGLGVSFITASSFFGDSSFFLEFCGASLLSTVSSLKLLFLLLGVGCYSLLDMWVVFFVVFAGGGPEWVPNDEEGATAWASSVLTTPSSWATRSLNSEIFLSRFWIPDSSAHLRVTKSLFYE